MLMFHMIDEFFFGGVDSEAIPTLIFTQPIASFRMMLHQITSLEFPIAFRAYEICMAHMRFDIMSMYMREPFEYFVTSGTFIIGEINVANKLAFCEVST